MRASRFASKTSGQSANWRSSWQLPKELRNSPHGTGPAYTTYTVLDSNGNSQVYQVNYEMIDFAPDVCSWGLGGLIQYSCSLQLPSNIAPSQLVLPNGTS